MFASAVFSSFLTLLSLIVLLCAKTDAHIMQSVRIIDKCFTFCVFLVINFFYNDKIAIILLLAKKTFLYRKKMSVRVYFTHSYIHFFLFFVFYLYLCPVKSKSFYMKIRYIIVSFFVVCLLALVFCWLYLFSPYWPNHQFGKGKYGSIGDIEIPNGFVRVDDDGSGYFSFLRSLPLAHPDSVVRDNKKRTVNEVAPYCYRLLDLPLLDKNEQCADVCIRLRTEYLFQKRRYSDIHFDDTRYQTMTYSWGNLRPALKRYLKKVFLMANTESLIHEMPQRKLEDIRPGDVFVYDVKSRSDVRYGHAIMVADVIVDKNSGRKMCMLVQGSTPACSIHILKNTQDSINSPWFPIDAFADTLDFGFARYLSTELRYFEPEHKYADFVKKQEMSLLAKGLIKSYPQQKLQYKDGSILFADGTSILFNDGRYKDFVDKLDNSDIEDMLSLPYDTTKTPGYLSDAGRSRNEDFFKKMYGSTKEEVKSHLVKVEWFGQKLKITKVNGVDVQLKKVAAELATHPELRPYLKNASTFNWRKVRGADRMSAHSYGIAIDINVDYSNYWKWKYPDASETKRIKYENRIPMEIVRIFERYGFIWGGRWYHYDTMHFEYRPEINMCR